MQVFVLETELSLSLRLIEDVDGFGVFAPWSLEEKSLAIRCVE